jgi:TRAP-type C4-dicarboxylate transport system permease large subunit
VAGTIGGIVPPSIVMILLAGSMGMSTGGLFMAGVLRGRDRVLLMAVAYVISVKRNYPRYEEPFRLWFCCGRWSARCRHW